MLDEAGKAAGQVKKSVGSMAAPASDVLWLPSLIFDEWESSASLRIYCSMVFIELRIE